jgi:hypothetical protein
LAFAIDECRRLRDQHRAAGGRLPS